MQNNSYALPDGSLVNLPSHCVDRAERFTLRDGSLVWAVRVDDGNPGAAARLAAEMGPARLDPAR